MINMSDNGQWSQNDPDGGELFKSPSTCGFECHASAAESQQSKQRHLMSGRLLVGDALLRAHSAACKRLGCEWKERVRGGGYKGRLICFRVWQGAECSLSCCSIKCKLQNVSAIRPIPRAQPFTCQTTPAAHLPFQPDPKCSAQLAAHLPAGS